MKSIMVLSLICSLIALNSNCADENRFIYYSNNFPWYVFYDSTNESGCDIVEIGGIKYGFIDKLEKTTLNDTISKSKNGILFYKKNNLVYYNYELKKEFKLSKVKYKSSFKAKRAKIFDTYAFFKIKEYSLAIEKKREVYEIANKDFEELESNHFNDCSQFKFEEFLLTINK